MQTDNNEVMEYNLQNVVTNGLLIHSIILFHVINEISPNTEKCKKKREREKTSNINVLFKEPMRIELVSIITPNRSIHLHEMQRNY